MNSGRILILDSQKSDIGHHLKELIGASMSYHVDMNDWKSRSTATYDLLLPVLSSSGNRWDNIFKELADRYHQAAMMPVINDPNLKPLDTLHLVKTWARDFITCPYQPLDVILRIERILKKSSCDKVEEVKKSLLRKQGLKKLVGNSQSFRELVNKIPLTAESDVEVIIQGETGTGKELVARALHYLSPRRNQPFISVNCAALPLSLFENELFGHTKEAFTDARTSRPGLIHDAEGGSIFLDEIDTLEPASQAKMLRFLQEKEYRPLGSSKIIKANVRIITASNADLKNSLETGRFRSDLFYRLNIVSLILPPLRERREDIPVLARHFLKKYESRFGARTFSPAALEALSDYSWPGNIRELENMVQYLMIFASDKIIGAKSLPFSAEHCETTRSHLPFQEAKKRANESFEKKYITNLLSINDFNITHAARAAGKDRRAFGRLVKKYNLEK